MHVLVYAEAGSCLNDGNRPRRRRDVDDLDNPVNPPYIRRIPVLEAMMANLALEAEATPRIRGLKEGDMRAALQQSNPDAAAGDLRTMARILKVVFDVVAELPVAKRREIAQEKERVRRALFEVASPAGWESGERAHIEDRGPVERSQGKGLGERLAFDEGRARLRHHAVQRPLESWAGPVAGAGEIEQRLGVPRSTLSTWQKRGAIVGLLRGERKLAYPLEQFVDGRPLEGVGDVLRVAPDARSAWLWLRQPHGALDGALPLERLRAGDRRVVIAAAERDFQ